MIGGLSGMKDVGWGIIGDDSDVGLLIVPWSTL
jgi:hypothetical protein